MTHNAAAELYVSAVRCRRVFIAGVTIAICLCQCKSIATAGEALSVQDDANALLRRSADVYRGFKSLKLKLTVLIAKGVESPAEIATYDVAIQKPRNVSFRVISGTGPNIVSNGKSLLFTLPLVNSHVLTDAPATFDALFTSQFAGAGDVAHAGSLVYDALIEGGAEISEKASELAGTRHLLLRQNGAETEFWISTGQYAYIRRIRFQKKQDTAHTVTLQLEEAKLDSAFDDALFYITPPQGSVKLSWTTLFPNK